MTRPGAALSAALVAAPLASAGVAAADTGLTAVAVQPGRARPAESGARDSAATLGPLAIGALVRDRNGAEIGHVTRMTTDKDGHSVAEVRHDEDLFSIPMDLLHAHRGKAFSSQTLDELKHSAAAH